MPLAVAAFAVPPVAGVFDPLCLSGSSRRRECLWLARRWGHCAVAQRYAQEEGSVFDAAAEVLLVARAYGFQVAESGVAHPCAVGTPQGLTLPG